MPLPIVPAPTTPIISATSENSPFRKILTAPVGRLRRRGVVAPSVRVGRPLRLPVVRAPVVQSAAPRLVSVRRVLTVQLLALRPAEEPERVDRERRAEGHAERREARGDDSGGLRPTLPLQHPVARNQRR